MKKSLFLLLSVLAAVWAQPKPFTIEDLYRIKYVGAPEVAPDGQDIAFTVSNFHLRKAQRTTHVYLMDRDGHNLRRFTSGGAEWSPCWSPTGKELAFLSNRENGLQIWLIPKDGGEAKRLTSWSSGIQDIVWSPDGKYIAFTSKVFPEYGADDKANQKENDAIATGPVKAYMADELLYRHWDSWKGDRANHILAVEVATGKLSDLTPGTFESPAFQLGGQVHYQFSPDAGELCFASNRDPDPACSTNCDLWTVPVTGGEAKNITAANLAYDGNPQYSPNGRYIAYRMQKIPGYESDLFRLALYDRETGKTEVLTEDFDNWINEFQWSPDSVYIYFTADVQGYTPLYRVEIDTKQITEIMAKTSVGSFSVSPHGDYIFFTRRSVDKPAELYRVSAEGRGMAQLTYQNDDFCREVDIRPAEQMWVTTDDGVSIHVFLVKPHGFDPAQKYPLILNVHGGPQSQWMDSFRGDWQIYPGAGYVVAFANPRGSTGYGQKFTAEISLDWGGKVFADLMKVVDTLERLPFVDKERMGAMGWSYGGYMMAWFEGNTDRFKAISCMMGVYDLPSMYGATEELWFPEWDIGGTPWESAFYAKWSPSGYVANFKTPCLVITGMQDFRVPYTQSLQFFTALQKRKVPSRLIVFTSDGHWPDYLRSMPVYYNAHLEWFHKYLGGGPAPWDTKKMLRNSAFNQE